MTNSILSDWYIIFERFSFNTEALSHAIKETKTLKDYMTLAHIRTAIKESQIEQFEQAVSMLMNMDSRRAKKYVKAYPDRIDVSYLELKAERLLEKLQQDRQLSSADIKSLSQAVDPIGKILEILLAKLVAEKKYKEVM